MSINVGSLLVFPLFFYKITFPVIFLPLSMHFVLFSCHVLINEFNPVSYEC